MTAFQLLAGLPALTLDAGCTVTLEAIDPATGAAVTGVAVTLAAIYAYNAVPEFGPSLEEATPLWLPVATSLPAG